MKTVGPVPALYWKESRQNWSITVRWDSGIPEPSLDMPEIRLKVPQRYELFCAGRVRVVP